MADRVAAPHIDFTANAAKLLGELEKSRKEILKLRKSVDQSANRVKYAFNKMRRAAQVFASAFIVAAFVRRMAQLGTAAARASDKIALMQARFQQFARTGDAFVRVYNQSKELGVSLDSTAESMTRLLVATKGLGTSQEVLEKVNRNIVLLGRAGGTSAEEMKGAMRQLSQGLASGRLQGEELRSVLENLPLVAMEIAKQMKIGLGSIRDVAAEGKITGQVVVDALEEIGIKMEDLPQTWAMQTENLRTEWDLFLNALSQAVDEAALLDQLVEAVKWVRTSLLGDLLTKGTPRLESERADMYDRQGALVRQGNALTGDNFLQTIKDVQKMKDSAPFDWMVTDFMLAEDSAQRLALEYIKLQEDIERYNQVLVQRANAEKLAAEMAQVRDEAGEVVGDSKLTADQKHAQRIMESLQSDLDALFAEVKAAEALVDKNELSVEAFLEYRAQLYDEIAQKAKEAEEIASGAFVDGVEEVKEATEKLSKGWKDLGFAFQSAFEDAIVEGNKLRDVLWGLWQDIMRIWVRKSITNPFMSFLFGGDFGGAQAMGGPVTAGTSYLVGENGPELWTASRSGNIIPNHDLSAAGGATVNNIYNIAAGVTHAELRTVLPPMLENNRQATLAQLRMLVKEGRFV